MKEENDVYGKAYEKSLAYFGDLEMADVYALHHKFSFPRAVAPRLLSIEDMAGRFRFMLEELNEFMEAVEQQDLAEAFDALIDLVYVAKGTAVQLGLPWSEGWDAVHDANMAKVRSPSKTDRGFDLLKPDGWKAPNHAKLLEFHGYSASGFSQPSAKEVT